MKAMPNQTLTSAIYQVESVSNQTNTRIMARKPAINDHDKYIYAQLTYFSERSIPPENLICISRRTVMPASAAAATIIAPENPSSSIIGAIITELGGKRCGQVQR